MFSFNAPFGACEKCTGLGVFMRVDPDLILPNKNLSIDQGAIKGSGWYYAEGSVSHMYYEGLAKRYGFSLSTPIKDLSKEAIDALLYGTKGEKLRMSYNRGNGMGVLEQPFEGILNNMSRR